jgi:pre-mRNA-splicing factor 38A
MRQLLMMLCVGLSSYLSRYLRALTAFYIRLTWKAIDVYETLEPLLQDYRKLRVRTVGAFLPSAPRAFSQASLTSLGLTTTVLYGLGSGIRINDHGRIH